ncbi:MAG: DUF4910 domain-containing protein [Chloroflexia bacterium]|nr:DUF4910 domain-containing protein [Chloroflexia bacterium]
MLGPTLKLLRPAISGQAALRTVAGVIAHHRIQSSPGFREAARFCLAQLRQAGLPAEILSFPGNGRQEYWGYLMPQEWNAQAATLRLVAPKKKARVLAEYRDHKIALIQRSAATPPEGLEAELVVLEDGEEPAEYEGLDLQGKFVLTRGDLHRVHELAVEHHGALGIVYDGMREEPHSRPLYSLSEDRQYTSFWWETTGRAEPTRCPGFVLPQQLGEWLRRLVRQEAAEGRTVRLHAAVDSSHYDGEAEVVEALIPGETAEEVWLIAHLCHPQPSANDNASGVATLLEVARSLARLIQTGKLPKPKRGLRFLLPPEMTGTYAYLATHEELIPNAVAALNLDMVGEDQAQCGSTLLLTKTPLSTPSLSDDLLALILETVAAEGQNFMGVGAYSLIRWAETPFSAGSDHYILADPSVGIPCPMLIQWPDRFYHTSADTLDKVDPEMLQRVGLAAAAYLWWLANAGPREAHWLGTHMVSRTEAQLTALRQNWLDQILEQDPVPPAEKLAQTLDRLRERLDLHVEHRRDSLRLLQRLAGSEHLSRASFWECETIEAGQREFQRAQDALQDLFGLEALPTPPATELDEWEQQAAHMVPRKLLRGPFPTNARWKRLSLQQQEDWRQLNKDLDSRLLPVLAGYWMDGRRTLLEIADLVERELGQRRVRELVRYCRFLETMGLVEIEG